MKNTKMRKKMLLSSIAMLMVATVSLGSATYAWFTSSTSATASGINVTTTKTSSLQISSKAQTWGSTVTYNETKTLYPASTSNFTVWKQTEATSTTDGTAKSDAPITDATNVDGGNQYYVAEMLNIKNAAETGGANVGNISVKVQVGNGAGKDYVRFALVPVTTKPTAGTIGTPSPASGKSGVDYIFADAATEYNAINATGDAFDAAVTPKVFSTAEGGSDIAAAMDLTDVVLTPQQELYYNLYVWFEGQDPECKDANAGKNVPSLDITVSGQTQQPTP